jgi:hypothetical protein
MYVQAFPWPPKMLQGLQKDPPYSCVTSKLFLNVLLGLVDLEKTCHGFFSKTHHDFFVFFKPFPLPF